MKKGGWLMKKGYILWLLISVISLPVVAQNIIYSNLKELVVQDGDTLAVLRVEKRSRSQILLTGGADYRITAGNDESMCRQLKKRCFAVRTSEGDLFINCRCIRLLFLYTLREGRGLLRKWIQCRYVCARHCSGCALFSVAAALFPDRVHNRFYLLPW